MENINLVFGGTERSGTYNHKLRCFWSEYNEIFIEIEGLEFPEQWICLSEQTAVKFSKEIQKQIGYLKDNKTQTDEEN